MWMFPEGAEGSEEEAAQGMLGEGHQTQSGSWKICGVLIYVKSPILWKRSVLQLNIIEDFYSPSFLNTEPWKAGLWADGQEWQEII